MEDAVDSSGQDWRRGLSDEDRRLLDRAEGGQRADGVLFHIAAREIRRRDGSDVACAKIIDNLVASVVVHQRPIVGTMHQ